MNSQITFAWSIDENEHSFDEELEALISDGYKMDQAIVTEWVASGSVMVPTKGIFIVQEK